MTADLRTADWDQLDNPRPLTPAEYGIPRPCEHETNNE